MTDFPVFSMKLYRLEVGDILRVEEHVTDSHCPLVNLDRMACENDTLGDDAGR
jgi:flagellar motor switch protein FliM